jgi:zinc protease
MSDRFQLPVVAPPESPRLPAIERSVLANGLRISTVRHGSLPVVAASLLIESGTADDPADLPGLSSLTAAMLDEGAGGRDPIEFAEVLAGIGATIELHTGPDATSIRLWMPARHTAAGLALLADVAARPEFRPADFQRVKELRLSRLQQLSRSAAAAAERVFGHAIFGAHGYGHAALGTTTSISRATKDDVEAHYARSVEPRRATLIAAGDVPHRDFAVAAADAFGRWSPAAVSVSAASSVAGIPPRTHTRIIFIERAGAQQSEIRIGHVGPPRAMPDYHAAVLFNAAFGGSFSGRLNQRLRQQLGYTYGIRSAFDLDRLAGTFVCEASVQGDKTLESVREIIDMTRELAAGAKPLSDDELELARGSLTRGYVRHFETPKQLAGAIAQLAVHGLPDDTFDRFVPSVMAASAADAQVAAARHVHPDGFVIVVVGDTPRHAELAALGVPVETVVPEF